MNLVDKLINYFDPVKGLMRSQSRSAQKVLRNYDVASRGRRNEGWFRPKSSAADEVGKAYSIGAASGQELVRNNPLANKIKRVWASNIVSSGIFLDIKDKSGERHDDHQDYWDLWANSTECDYEGHHNLYGLQHLWAGTMVESGGVFIIKRINASLKNPLQLQTLEQTQLDEGKNENNTINGIQFDKKGKLEGYWFIVDESIITNRSKFFKASEVIHIYKKERVGQHLGMTWFANIAGLLRNYDTYMDAKLLQQQVAACFALIVADSDSNLGIKNRGNNDGLLPDSIESGMIEYVPSGTDVTTVSPPKADNSSQFDDSIKGDMAMGVGLTREQLTGKFDNVNFASGRMAKNEFNADLDFIQNIIFKPALEKVFQWSSSFYQIKRGVGDYYSDWTFPIRSAVDPKEEFDTLMSKVRHGMLSPSKAAKMSGEKLELVVAQWLKDKELFGKLPFDLDPSVFARTGNQLDENDAASRNNSSKNKGEDDV